MISERNSRFVSRLTRDTIAIVLAGGRGTRLMQLTSHRAKPAVPFGGSYRIIDFTLSNCINSGIRRVGVLTQYKSSSLLRHLQRGWGFMRGQFGEFVEPLPAEQTIENPSWYAGTADAVYQNLGFVLQHQPVHVLVLAGDHVYKMDYGFMLAHHVRSGAKITVGCLEVPLHEARDFGVMQVDDSSRVIGFEEKPERPRPLPGRTDVALASMGIYVFDADFLTQWLARDARLRESRHDFGRDVVPAAIEGGGVYAYPLPDLHQSDRQGYWRDVGTLDAYWLANIELTGSDPELDLHDEDWLIWSHHKHVPPAKFILDAPGLRGLAVDSLISGGCVVCGAQIRNSVLFAEARVDRGSQVDHSLLLPRARVGRNCRLRKVIVDEDCVIPDGMVIGEHADEDARQFHRSDGGVTLVTADMLEDLSRQPVSQVQMLGRRQPTPARARTILPQRLSI